jgi:SAM-dependent methyltransferase
MSDALVRAVGWPATILHGDAAVYDRWRWVRDNLAAGPVRTLDAGCGSGAFSLYAARRGNRVLGLSFDRENHDKAVRRASVLGLKNVEFRVGDLRRLHEFGEELGTFDQVICLETIEHILDDQKLVTDLAARLNPGGRLLLTTPYKHYKPLLGDHLSEGEDGGHVRYGYTRDELEALFTRAGLVVEREEYLSGWVTQRLINLFRRLGRVSPAIGWAVTLPLRAAQVVDRPVTNALSYPYLSVALVGVKRA